MMKTGRRKIILYSFHPLIRKNFTAGFTEASFTEMRDDNILIRIVWTSIFMITQLVRIATREHLLYCPDDILAKRIFVARQIILPMLLEYLFYGEAIRACLLYHNNSIFRSVEKATNEYNIRNYYRCQTVLSTLILCQIR